MEPVALTIFDHMWRTDKADLVLMPDLSVVPAEGEETRGPGCAYMYQGDWLCFWREGNGTYLTYKKQTLDISGCRGSFRLRLSSIFDWPARKFFLKRGQTVVAEFDTRIPAIAYTDPTYDSMDFEHENFFAWIDSVLRIEQWRTSEESTEHSTAASN